MKDLVGKKEARSAVVGVFESYTERAILWPTGLCCDCGEAINKLPPIELAELLKGDSWVLEELKKILHEKDQLYRDTNGRKGLLTGSLFVDICNLESRAPSDTGQAEENERKAEVFTELCIWLFSPEREGKYILLSDLKEKINKLLSQSKIPPTVEEEKK